MTNSRDARERLAGPLFRGIAPLLQLLLRRGLPAGPNVLLTVRGRRTAREYIHTALTAIRELQDVARLPLILDLAMAMALKEGRLADALRLAGGAARRRGQLGGGTPNFVVNTAEVVAEARAALAERGDAGAADQAWAEGESLDDDALAALIGKSAGP